MPQIIWGKKVSASISYLAGGGRLTMRLFAAVSGFLPVASCSAAALAQEEKTYNQPIWFDDWLDWCLKWNADCGQPTADNFCKRKRYIGASSFAAELAVGWHGSVCAGLSVIALVTLTSLLPTGFASADDCHVTESGIPKNVIAPVDVAGIRESLATDGIALGGSILRSPLATGEASTRVSHMTAYSLST